MDPNIIAEIEKLKAIGLEWSPIADRLHAAFGLRRSPEGWRKVWLRERCRRGAGSMAPVAVPVADAPRGKETIVWKGDGSVEADRVVELSTEDLKNPRAILLAHGFDPTVWELVFAKNSVWDVNLKAGDVAKFYASKITARPKTAPDAVDLEALLANVRPLELPAIPRAASGGRVLELTLADLHLNKLAWRGETGNDYDLSIACKRVHFIVNDVIRRMGDEVYDRIIVPVGNDLFNSDNSEGTTHAGTPQSNDTRQAKVFETALTLFAGIIEKLRGHADRVEVILVQGNHDEDTSMMFAHALKAWFRTTADVTVDASPLKRKYLKIGRCLLVLGHFDADSKRIAELIPAEERRMWGEAEICEVHGAHLHAESDRPFAGFMLRRAPSVTGRDKWHYDSGYLAQLVHTTYVWDPDSGIETTWYTRIRKGG